MTLTIRKTLIIFGMLISMIIIGNFVVSAQDPFCSSGGGGGTAYCQAQAENPLEGEGGIFRAILDVIYWLAVVVSVIGVMIGGFRYMTSGGDAGKAASARNIIIYSLVGLIVTLAAGAIVSFVLSETSNN